MLKHIKQNWELWDIWPNYFTFQIANNKGTDQTGRLHLVARKQQSHGFSHRGLFDVEAQASWPPPGYVPEY